MFIGRLMKRYIEADLGVDAKTACGRSETREMSRLIYSRQIKVQLICQLSMREHTVHSWDQIRQNERKLSVTESLFSRTERSRRLFLSIAEIQSPTLGLHKCVLH